MPARRPVSDAGPARMVRSVSRSLAAAVGRVGFGPLGIAGGWNVANGNAVRPQWRIGNAWCGRRRSGDVVSGLVSEATSC